MNNSLEKLIDGMAETIRRAVIPHVDGEFARGQAFGVIYMLNSIRLRASWSVAFLGEQLAALDELSAALAAIPGLAGAPRPVAGRAHGDAASLEAARNAGDQAVSDLIVWLDTPSHEIEPGARAAADAAIAAYVHRQLRHEIRTSARPMFSEMSRGEE